MGNPGHEFVPARRTTIVCRPVLAVLVAVVLIPCVWAAPNESARQAAEKTFPNAPENVKTALVALLTALEDGSKITIVLDGKEASFYVEGGVVQVGKPVPELGPYSSAVVFHLDTRVRFGPLRTELERNNRRVVASSDDALSFTLGALDDVVTVTTRGTMCVRSTAAMDGLGIVDRLEGEAAEAVGYLRRVNADVTSEGVQRGWRERRYYCDPPYSYKVASFLAGATGDRAFRAVIDVTKVKVESARLRVESSDAPPGVPTIILSDQPVIQRQYAQQVLSGEIKDLLQPGTHDLVSQGIGTMMGYAARRFNPWALTLQVIAASEQDADFSVAIEDKTTTSLSSAPMDKITKQWEDLRGLLP
jgi:hypothetical protein